MKIGLISAWVLGLAFTAVRLGRPALKDGLSFSQAIFDRSGTLMRLSLSKDEKYRLWTPLREISPILVEATVKLEDRHFRQHAGLNPVSLGRAFWQTYVRRGRRVGGSTLTMQLARLRMGIPSKSVTGKAKQILGAVGLELFYSKNEILEAYLNLVPYGGNIEGIGAASLVYFHKDSRKLNLPEALTLASIPQNPNHRGLHSNAESRSLRDARAAAFQSWNQNHGVSGNSIVESSLAVRSFSASELPFTAPHFTDSVLRDAPLKGRHFTTLDIDLQRMIERQAATYVTQQRTIGIQNAAVMLIDHEMMEVRAILGSVDYFDAKIEGQVNGTRAKRSPGSALKPFIYGLAMEQGLIHPLTVLKDAPASFGGFDPENFDGDFVGPITATDALIRSRNIPAVQLASQLRPSEGLYDLLKRAGVTRLKSEKHYGLALPLGGAEVTMEELVRLYSVLPNAGMLRTLHHFKDERDSASDIRILSPEASFLVMDMLKDNPRPDQQFRSEWTRDPVPVHWKTGTSHGFRDAWAVGAFGHYTLAVWIGNFNGEGNPSFVGRDAAGPLFFQMVDAIRSMERKTLARVRVPDEQKLTQVNVCPISGHLPGPFCTHKIKTWFIPGKSPIKTCDIHRQIAVSARSGFRLCSGSREPAQMKVFEFWPSDLMKLFRQAGIARTVPPPFEPGCGIELKAQKGSAPAITSPKRDLIYGISTVGSASKNGEVISLAATTDTDARELYWFLNDQFLGKSASSQPFLWSPHPGKFIVRVVDDLGRSDARELHVTPVQ